MHNMPAIARCIKFILLIFPFAACHYSTTSIKNPTFRASTDSLGESIMKLVACQKINLDGKEINTDGRARTALNIEILNPGNLSSNTDSLHTLGKEIAVVIKGGLTDPKSFEVLNVIFINQKTTGGMSVSSNRGFEYQTDTLK